jgi:hypothetical protein
VLFKSRQKSKTLLSKLTPTRRAHDCIDSKLFRPRVESLEDRTLLSAGDLDPSFGMGGQIFSAFPGPLDSQATPRDSRWFPRVFRAAMIGSRQPFLDDRIQCGSVER